MNNEMRLARVDLGPGWIDLGYGEPVVIQEIFRKHMNPAVLPNKDAFLQSQYQPPQGMDGLVKLLEAKYQAKVVITNGAKQGIAAAMYALAKAGHTSCMIHSPYWTSTPSLVESSGLRVEVLGEGEQSARAMLITSPNNPDGKELRREDMAAIAEDAVSDGITIVHDAAYYTPIYMAQPHYDKFGDIQIYSFAKMYGLSGLRIGYAVLHNESFLPAVTEFVERSCSGVSTASQQVALAVETWFLQNPEALMAFQQECRDAIRVSRAELAKLNPDVLQLEECGSNSMFGWCKVGPKFNAATAKVNVLDGALFGRPGYVRINIAVHPDLIKTAVERLNNEVQN